MGSKKVRVKTLAAALSPPDRAIGASTPTAMFHPRMCGYLGGATLGALGRIVHEIHEVLFVGSRGGGVVRLHGIDARHRQSSAALRVER